MLRYSLLASPTDETSGGEELPMDTERTDLLLLANGRVTLWVGISCCDKCCRTGILEVFNCDLAGVDAAVGPVKPAERRPPLILSTQ